MADEQQKRQVFAGIWQFFLAAPQGRPALIVFDDLHWADRSSIELLGFLLERLNAVPIMIVLTIRPGFEQIERLALRASHTAIHLERMSAEESVAVARGFLGVIALPDDLERIIATRAEGNPFFIEELLQALLELGSLAIVDGRAVLAKVDVEMVGRIDVRVIAVGKALVPKRFEPVQLAFEDEGAHDTGSMSVEASWRNADSARRQDSSSRVTT